MTYKFLKQTDLFERIGNQYSLYSNQNQPPFTLIIGSGFSYGIIPTTAQIVQVDLPWWKSCQQNGTAGVKNTRFFDQQSSPNNAEDREEAIRFWKRVHESQMETGTERFELDPNTGLPTKETIGQAYRFALSPNCTPGLNTPHEVRRYFGDIIRRAGKRLNPAHLFLASIIAERPRLFGTIFTTNFDPLLQRSLQLVNAPYFVSDRPETFLCPDDDDVADAVHVIHSHGSIYRYLLLNNPDEIEKYADANHPKLQEYFRKHAIIIVGFSGWDDAITRALGNVPQFEHNLYWCDRSADPNKSSLTQNAREILTNHPNAFYVPIHGADDLMSQLHQHLTGHSLPKIFREPILSAIDQIGMCNLDGIKLKDMLPSMVSVDVGKMVGPSNVAEERDLGDEVKKVRNRLSDAQNLFTGKTLSDQAMLAAQVRQRFAEANDLYFSNKYLESLPHFEFVIEQSRLLDKIEVATALIRRGYIYGLRNQNGDPEKQFRDYTTVIEMADVPSDLKAKALINRGVSYNHGQQSNDADRKIADYTAVIHLPGAPADLIANAHFNRGVSYGRRNQPGDKDLEILDYTAAIEITGVTPLLRANAYFNRGVSFGQRNQPDDKKREINDYTAVIDMPNAPVEQLAKAYLNRGVSFSQRNQSGDVDRSIADCTAVIDLPNAPIEQRAKAYVNRGGCYGQRNQTGDLDRAIADSTAVIDMPNAPIEQRAKAYVNRGICYGQRRLNGDRKREISDYTSAIQLPDAPLEQRAKAHINRGFSYGQRNQAGDKKREIDDYTCVIAMSELPASIRAKAYLNRGSSYGRRNQAGDKKREIAEYSMVIEMPDVTVEQRAEAYLNRANAYAKRNQPGDADRRIADYEAVMKISNLPEEMIAKARKGLETAD